MMYDYSSASSCNATLSGPSLQSICTAAEFVVFMTALDEAIRNNPNISRRCERVKPIVEPDEEYDFIVAGGGGAGAVVAGRLAENTDWKILLLEAGDDESAAGQIPGFAGSLRGTEIDWNYHTTNESCSCLANNGSCYWSAAKSLGGGTAHNGMIYMRGVPKDFDNWAELGNYGWGWEEVFKSYKKQEDNANVDELGSDYHGKGGPLPVGFFPYISVFGKRFLKAAEHSRSGISKDLNGEDILGFGLLQGSQKNGVRVSSATAYLNPHRDSKNLHISLKSYVTKVIIENYTAVGVEYVKNGKLGCVRAKKEVIISTGTMRSPQLLLLSGIGPKDHLESHGIPVILDRPGVGKNLHDHVIYNVTFTMNDTDTYVNNEEAAKEYLKYQTGPLSTSGESLFAGAVYTNRTTPDYPDVQVLLIGNIVNCPSERVGASRTSKSRQTTFAVGNLHPKSRGRVSLASNNPLDYPVLWANYLSEKSDADVLIDGIEMLMGMVAEKPLQEFDFRLLETPIEACSNYAHPSREYWDCAIRQETPTAWHQVGTCKMGPASDPMAVVDPELRVHGMQNLRVIDASIMPMITSFNTAAPTMMIGERGATFINNTWFSCNK